MYPGAIQTVEVLRAAGGMRDFALARFPERRHGSGPKRAKALAAGGWHGRDGRWFALRIHAGRRENASRERMQFADFRAHGPQISSGVAEAVRKIIAGAKPEQAGLQRTKDRAGGIRGLHRNIPGGGCENFLEAACRAADRSRCLTFG